MHSRIPLLYAGDFSKELEEWCVDNDIRTHYDDSVAWIENDGNPMWKFLLDNGDVTEDQKDQYIAVQGT